jgi:hypothetical protein
MPVKVLYMGINLESSNVTLPTSRLIRYLKRQKRQKSAVAPAGAGQARSAAKSGKIRAALRLGNRLAEEWYRQLLIWRYLQKGSLVICDRHFQFDFDYGVTSGAAADRRLSERVHRWCLAKLYPNPELVIFLDAPGHVLFARKGEASVEWLESRRQALLKQGEKTANFFRVDATKPVEAVCAEVQSHILDFQRSRFPMDGLVGQTV